MSSTMPTASSMGTPGRAPQLVSTAEALRAALHVARQRGSIGLVPTMGALHEGHLSLIQAARTECDSVVVSIFVNRTQFGPTEDFAEYPRDSEGDLRKCGDAGVDVVFAPTNEEVYPRGFATYVEVEGIADVLEGACRPGHFRGVATIVLKLFNLVAPDVAYFGQKDYQQTLVVRRIIADLNLQIDLRVCPTVREPDGLALSSRNQYLTTAGREQALVLYRSLMKAKELVAAGTRSASKIRQTMHEMFRKTEGVQLEYADIDDPETLKPLTTIEGPAIALVAARVGRTRLIDNLMIEPPR